MSATRLRSTPTELVVEDVDFSKGQKIERVPAGVDIEHDTQISDTVTGRLSPACWRTVEERNPSHVQTSPLLASECTVFATVKEKIQRVSIEYTSEYIHEQDVELFHLLSIF